VAIGDKVGQRCSRSSFYICRSQKHKKKDICQSFWRFREKAARKMFMKLTPGENSAVLFGA